MTSNRLVPAGALRIQRAIETARSNGRGVLAPFLSAGYPSRDAFATHLNDVLAAADIVEIGVPFSDPIADGPVIQRSSRVALENGVSLEWIFEHLGSHKTDVPQVLMSYVNPILAYGLDRFSGNAADSGVCGAIVPDLPLEEAGSLREALHKADIGLIQIVSPVTPEARLSTLCNASDGFVYASTVMGVTGLQGAIDPAVAEYMDRVRSCAPGPVLAGFGIRSAMDASLLRDHCDGVIVGSALIEAIDRGEDAAKFLNEIKRGLELPQQEHTSS